MASRVADWADYDSQHEVVSDDDFSDDGIPDDDISDDEAPAAGGQSSDAPENGNLTPMRAGGRLTRGLLGATPEGR